ncbi:MAG: polysaccharide pyruvyl transferase family protein [Gelidibacter sp.]
MLEIFESKMNEVNSDKINMFWHKVPFGKKNFGDVLGPYIVENLSGKKPMYTPLLHTGFNKLFVLTYLRAIYNRKLSVKEMYYNIQFLLGKKQNLLLTIGSVIDWYTNPNCDIWGSGIIKQNCQITNANFYAVRGKHTQLRLKQLGYQAPEAIGDPALLMPLIFTPKVNKKYKLGIIPHFLHYEEIIEKLNSDDVLIINLFDAIEKVIEDVCSCEKIISSSLHGIIIGHAYDVPSLWFGLASGNIGGDDIKFADYFSSVEIREYERFKIDHNRYDENYLTIIESLFDEHKELTLVTSEILKKIQGDLIKSAPFTIRPQFREIGEE